VIEGTFAKADEDRDGHLSKVEFTRVLQELRVKLKERDVEALWKRHADSGFMQTHLNYKQFIKKFSDLHISSTSQPHTRDDMQSRPESRKNPNKTGGVAPRSVSCRSSVSRTSERPASRASSTASSAKRLTLDCSPIQKMSSSRTHQGKVDGNTARSSSRRGSLMPQVSLDMLKPSPVAMKQLSNLKEHILSVSLNMLKKFKHEAPDGAVKLETFFDTLEKYRVPVSDSQILVIVKAFTDQQGMVRYPLFFKGFAELKDHHDEEYADGYFQDGSYEGWQAQQAAQMA